MIDASSLCLGDEFAGGVYLGGDFVVAPGYIPRMTLSDGYIYCQFIRINGYIDWRMPTWKELDYIRRFPFTQQYLELIQSAIELITFIFYTIKSQINH